MSTPPVKIMKNSFYHLGGAQQAVNMLANNCQNAWSNISVHLELCFRPPVECKFNVHATFISVLVSINSWGNYLSFCSPARHLLCPSAVWCWEGSLQWVYRALFKWHWWELWEGTKTVKLRAIKPKQWLKDTQMLHKAEKNCRIGW